MRWKPKPKWDPYTWHRTFAFTPVEAEDGSKAWLEYVERRATHRGYSMSYGVYYLWEYRWLT